MSKQDDILRDFDLATGRPAGAVGKVFAMSVNEYGTAWGKELQWVPGVLWRGRNIYVESERPYDALMLKEFLERESLRGVIL